MPARFHCLAREGHLNAFRRYQQRSRLLALRFREDGERALARIEASPQQWPAFQGKYRWVRAGRFPYLVSSEVVDPSDILILAVAHLRRRPGYWKRRKGY